MDTRRYDNPNVRSKVTNDDQKFKKVSQTVGKPQVTDHDIHEDYLRDPPNNQPNELSTDRKTRGLKERAQEETDHKQEGVLGDEPTGRIKKDAALRSMTTENSLHS